MSKTHTLTPYRDAHSKRHPGLRPTSSFSSIAKWIWLPGEEAPVNAVIDFQGRFKLTKVPTPARLLISADSRYHLHVNGVRVGFGPGRCYPGHYEFDEHEISVLLHPGENVVDVRVLHWGEGTCQSLVLRGGMICEIQNEKGKPISSSSTSWRVRRAKAYQSPTPRIACQLSFEEQVDLTFERGPANGRSASGGGWAKPVEIGQAGAEPWGALNHRSIPMLEGDTSSPLVVKDYGFLGHEGLVLPLRAGPDLGCDGRKANSEHVDGIFSTLFHAARAGTLRIRRSAMYGDVIRVFLDGRKIVLQQGRFDYEAEVEIKRGCHVLVLDWKGTTHDTDVGLSLSGVLGLRHAYFPGHSGAVWLFARPGKWRAKIRVSSSAMKLLACGASWRPVAAKCVPLHDVYVAMTARDIAPMTAPTEYLLPMKITPRPDGGAQRVVLDFGAQRNGWIDMDFIAGEGSVIEVMGVDAWGPEGPQFTAYMNNTARIVCRKGRQSFQSLVVRGFRYLMLDIAPRTLPLKLLGVKLREETYPWKPRGRFFCSDTRLNRIYEMCQHTLRMSSADVFVDGTYEQALWVGDAASLLLPVHYYVQGEKLLPERCLQLCAQSLDRIPLVNSQVPSAFENRLIPNWSFFWVAGVRMNYEYSGDLAFLREMLPALWKQVDFLARSLDEEGLFVKHEGVWHFLDWNGTANDPHKSEYMAYCHENCLALASLQDSAWMAAEVGDQQMASRCRALARQLRSSIRAHFWLPCQLAFGETRFKGVTSSLVTASTQICALRAGLFPKPTETARKVLAPPPDWISTGTPWMWSLGALEACANGQAAEVYSGIARHWGRMLDRGATAAWEIFEGRYREGVPSRSWCHGWSSGPAWILPAFALGVRPSAPGWREVIIAPQPGDLLWAEGVVPTPHGDIKVRWEMRNGKLFLDYEAPPGVSVNTAPT